MFYIHLNMSNLFSGKMVDSTTINLTTWRGKMRNVEYFSKMPRRNAEILARKKSASKSQVEWAVYYVEWTVVVYGTVIGADLLTFCLEEKSSH